MADPEVPIEAVFGEFKLVLKARLGHVKELQKKIGGLLAMAEKFRTSTVTIEDLAWIIWYGAQGVEGQKVPAIAALEEIIFEHGVLGQMKPCAEFLRSIFDKGSKGKATAPEALQELPGQEVPAIGSPSTSSGA